MKATETDPASKSTAPVLPGVLANPARMVQDVAVALLLLSVLVVVWVVDQRASPVVPPVIDPPRPVTPPEPPPEPPVIEMPEDVLPPIDRAQRVVVRYKDDSRFGLSTTTGNPLDPSDDNKQLTYSKDGSTNNTRVSVDGATPLFGGSAGRVLRPMREVDEGRIEAEWEYNEVRVKQTIQLVAGDLSRRMDSIRVEYRIENNGTTPRTVGLRMMLDSLIGGNDGVPFIVPGQEQIVTSPQAYRGAEVPDFVRALEIGNLVNPGVIADLGLRPEEGERPDEVILTHWPGSEAAWDYNRTEPFGTDTAIGLYYDPEPLPPGASRLIRFTYGLGTISSVLTRNVNLSLTAGGPFRAGGKFWLVALVQGPKEGQRVRLELPPGLTLHPEDHVAKPVPTGTDYTQLSWLVQIDAAQTGAAEIKARLEPDGVEERCQLTIRPRDARLTLIPKGPFRSGKPFWMVALVQDGKPGQTVELRLPSGFTLAEGSTARQPVPSKEGYSQVNWLVEVPGQTSGEAGFSVRLLPDGIEQRATVEIQAGSLIE